MRTVTGWPPKKTQTPIYGTPDVIHNDQGPAFRNELISELSRLSQVEHSFAISYSKEENGLVDRAYQEVMRHLRAMLFDARVHDNRCSRRRPLESLLPNAFSATRYVYRIGSWFIYSRGQKNTIP